MNATNILINDKGQLRNGWWIGIFFLMLFPCVAGLIFISTNYGFEITIWHQLVIIVVVTLICQAIKKEPFVEISGHPNSQWYSDLLAGSIIGSGLMILPALVLIMSGAVALNATTSPIDSIVSAIATMLAVAIAEEFLFRGFIFRRLMDSVGQWPAQGLISGLFLLTHLDNPGMIGVSALITSLNIMMASILFGIAFIKTSGLAMPIGMHFMANVLQGPVLGFGVSGNQDASMMTPTFSAPSWITGGQFGLEGSIVGLVAIAGLTIWCARTNSPRA